MARFHLTGLLSFVSSAVLLATSTQAACPGLLQNAKAAADHLQSRDFWFGTYLNGARAWTNANTVEDLNNLMLAANIDDYAHVIDTVFTWDEINLQTAKSYDDVQWVVMAYLKVCDYLGARGKDTSFCFSRAELFYKIAESAWDDHCGGGLWWSGARDYKNAITNHLFIFTSAEFYRRKKDQRYLDNAKKTWNWLKSTNMRNSNGLWNDGLNTGNCQNNGQTVWTYNQAVVASGLASLHSATGDKSLLQEGMISLDATIARMTTNGILRESCDDTTGGSKCNLDQQIFKGIFTKHLQFFIDEARDPLITAKYAGFLGAQASAVIHYGTGGDGAIGSVWYAPNQSGSQFTPISQTSGMAALIAAAKYANC